MHTMKRRACFGLAALAFASCSSNSAAAPPTIGGTPAPTTAETTPAPTTSPPPATSIPTTTLEATTLPATTTTVATEDLIKTAVRDFISAYITCGQLPARCDPTTFTAAQGDTRGRLISLASGMSEQGLYFSGDLRGSHLNSVVVRLVNSSQATVESCWYDAGVVLGPIGPDGQPTVVNDKASSTQYSHTLFLEEGLWRVAEQNELVSLGDGDKCGTDS